ncbi:reverse transcriptase-like protein [Candidatus Poribacteria bacterium]|nr:reverse transcriptase-like protein [Candidatus Poribacteria bacterium]
MLKIYTDAAFDDRSGLGTYCLVVVTDKGFKDWSVDHCDGFTNSTDAEYVGLRAAVELARAAHVAECLIMCDSMAAIDRLQAAFKHRYVAPVAGLYVRHFKGHQAEKQGAFIDEDVKRHHWADVQAGAELDRRLDARKTGAYNDKAKET